MPKPKFVELKFTDTGYPRHSLTGYFVISECRSAKNAEGQNMIELFLRLPDADAGPPVSLRSKQNKKPRKKRGTTTGTALTTEDDPVEAMERLTR